MPSHRGPVRESSHGKRKRKEKVKGPFPLKPLPLLSLSYLSFLFALSSWKNSHRATTRARPTPGFARRATKRRPSLTLSLAFLSVPCTYPCLSYPLLCCDPAGKYVPKLPLITSLFVGKPVADFSLTYIGNPKRKRGHTPFPFPFLFFFRDTLRAQPARFLISFLFSHPLPFPLSFSLLPLSLPYLCFPFP